MASSSCSPMAATALAGDLEILVPMAGLIDTDAELARLAKEIDKMEKDRSRVEGKLANPSFVDKAPDAVVAKEREKLETLQQALEKLRQQEHRIQSL